MPEPFPILVAATPNDAGKRLDQFLAAHLDVSRARVQQLIAQQKVLVNDAPAKASLKLRGGERVTSSARPSARLCAPSPKISRSTSSTKTTTSPSSTSPPA